jgi:AcrR family transcriptional regulator
MARSALPFFVEPSDPPAKQEILKAALKLFARDGVRESSIRAVADEAGFTNPALFKHFASKDALALHLFERCYARIVRELLTALAGEDRFRTRLGRVIDAMMRLLDEAPEAVLFVNEELRRFWPRVSPAVRRQSVLRITAEFFQEGRRVGAVASDIDEKLLVAAFWGLLGQFARMFAFGEMSGAAVGMAPELERLVFKMVRS